MADFDTCYDWMMNNEDATRTCAVVADPTKDNPTAKAISGVNSAAWPDEYAVIAELTRDKRVNAIEQFYQRHFWNRWLEQVASDQVAIRVFDMAVNGGAVTAVRLLQQAVNKLRTMPVLEDGVWGPATLSAVNAVDPTALRVAFAAKRATHYKAIGGPNLPVWLARAAR